ncbi:MULTISPECIES: choice-of-anchor D domain-containing protein [unclassified Oceanispirochaeta]|uniref:choice-of-anchor D domain-containing protein n=1 Tax=unclassified Oceanispirochaeta TaxID=2635722 RepID=UPI000E095EEA|nr:MULTISPECIES: choice-of-anchor D domain-containing protein [unclassified Oceanispirochaeta]MBF9015803.1 choice-of-anchor D domain-containing protein [Oceanispirochaeta sp. M2]NPD72266.1 choice-of-anchor D domain-containing protein [Oceanispirochaeta sp. M1]RDG32362.1 choice-of-anchor D domain-containing protein [Oceanispirochaeta sp. M1]
MQLFNSIFSRKARSGLIITTLFLSVLLAAGSCKADFNVALEDYLSAVAGGKVIAVRIDDTRVEYGTPVDFSYQKIGSSSDPTALTIENIGQIDMTVSAILVDMMGIAGTPYSLNMGDLELPLTLQPGESSSFEVVFNPTVIGPISGGGHEELLNAAITIASNDAEYSAFSIPLTGTGALGEIAVYQSSTEYTNNGDPYLFDVTAAGSNTAALDFALKNTGNVDLAINGFSVDNTDAAFDIVHSISSGLVIAAGESLIFSVAFDPDVDGGFPLTFTILSDDKDESTFEFNLRGATNIPHWLDDVAFWLDAEKILPAHLESGHVTKWIDVSGRGFDAESFNPGGVTVDERLLPEYIASGSGIGGKASVRFVNDDGLGDEGDLLYISSQVLDTVQGLSFFVVLQPGVIDASTTGMYLTGNATGSSLSPYFRVYTTYFFNRFMGMTYTSNSATGVPIDLKVPVSGKKYLITNIFDNETSVIEDRHRNFVNGTDMNSISIINEPTGIRIPNLYIGNYYSIHSRYGFDGDIAEILIFSKSLTDAEVDLVHTYLNDKYAIY